MPLYVLHYKDYEKSIVVEHAKDYIREYVAMGIPDEKTALAKAIKHGAWSDKEEIALKEQKGFVESLTLTRDKLILPSQKKKQQRLVDKETIRLNRMQSDRREALGRTAEDFADIKSYEKFVFSLFYKDPECTQKAFSKEEEDELEPEDVEALFKAFKAVREKISEPAMNELVTSHFFSSYLIIAEDPSAFFGKNVFGLSSFQVRLISLAKIYTNIFKNYQVPDSISHDYEKVLAFVRKENRKYNSELKGGSSGDEPTQVAYVGATKEDLEQLEPDTQQFSLLKAMKRNGGKMNMEELAKLQG